MSTVDNTSNQQTEAVTPTKIQLTTPPRSQVIVAVPVEDQKDEPIPPELLNTYLTVISNIE